MKVAVVVLVEALITLGPRSKFPENPSAIPRIQTVFVLLQGSNNLSKQC